MADRGVSVEKEEKHRLQFSSFPYKPYPIQTDFMNYLYTCLDRGGISMLQSPTGTGKTLSIICSSLQWLLDQKNLHNSPSDESIGDPINVKTKIDGVGCMGGDVSCDDNQTDLLKCRSGFLCMSDLGRASGGDDDPDWMREFRMDKRDVNDEKTETVKNMKTMENKRKKKMSRDGIVLIGERTRDPKVDDSGISTEIEEFMIDYEEEEDSEEEDECNGEKRKKKKKSEMWSSEEDEEEVVEDGFNGDAGEENRRKVYFCTRTHSQLSQFVKEFKKTELGKQLNVISLGSRKHFCINQEVVKLGGSTIIAERCLELQRNKSKKVSKSKGGKKKLSGCPMLGNRRRKKEFRDEVVEQGAMDIEDLVRVGTKLGFCPYYGSRSMVPAADLVILPYQSLLLKSSRESLGLDLKQNVIIIDEAHNLADTLTRMYDAKVTLSQLEYMHGCLEGYYRRFCNLLGPGKRRFIQTLIILTQAFAHFLTVESTGNCETGGVCETGPDNFSEFSMTINEFLFSLNVDNINLVKVVKFIKDTHIIHKVQGYTEWASASKGNVNFNNGDGSRLTGFRAFVNMLQSLTNNDGEGRMIISRADKTLSKKQEGYLKYVMLMGSKLFSEITGEAHAVVLAGGTLEPVEETRERLFPWLPSAQLSIFSCGHIVPPESILPLVLTRGPSGLHLEFTYSSRSSRSMIKELGLVLINAATVIPQGVVVFFSSFEYENDVYNIWNETGILERLGKKKRVFREPRGSTEVDSLLQEYKDTIFPSDGCSGGAVLMAVVGGKMSEGINFSDGMGRCVVMVGLPFPSPSDIELLERIKHIECQGDASWPDIIKRGLSSGFDVIRGCRRRGKEYYENLCMKAVNQSVGRAIRHINDYAAILLVDVRYAGDDGSGKTFSKMTSKLPQWIKSRLDTPHNYGEAHGMLRNFFNFNKDRGNAQLN